ncbi:MAG: hypothetical protein NXH75_11925, partial [Halobacteriovoraceae bacterium]|nr:hypothetical protein [Halobacteriovoraceae bacterium]
YEYYSTASLFSIFYGSNPRRATSDNLKDVLNQSQLNPLLFVPKGFRLESWTKYSYQLIETFNHKNLDVLYLK